MVPSPFEGAALREKQTTERFVGEQVSAVREYPYESAGFFIARK
jgi:hypothetical protein